MGLQKVTELKGRVQELLKQETIDHNEIESLSPLERDEFFSIATGHINDLKGDERDRFLVRIDRILSNKTRNEIWEIHHVRIIQAITQFIEEYGRMPLKVELSDKVGLSRQTLSKHFKEYKTNPVYTAHLEQFHFMTQKLLAKMFQFAIRGDVKAGRLYFDMIGQMGGTTIKNQTNYIQVNNLIISEERLKTLRPEQLRVIEEIFAEVETTKVKTPSN